MAETQRNRTDRRSDVGEVDKAFWAARGEPAQLERALNCRPRIGAAAMAWAKAFRPPRLALGMFRKRQGGGLRRGARGRWQA